MGHGPTESVILREWQSAFRLTLPTSTPNCFGPESRKVRSVGNGKVAQIGKDTVSSGAGRRNSLTESRSLYGLEKTQAITMCVTFATTPRVSILTTCSKEIQRPTLLTAWLKADELQVSVYRKLFCRKRLSKQSAPLTKGVVRSRRSSNLHISTELAERMYRRFFVAYDKAA